MLKWFRVLLLVMPVLPMQANALYAVSRSFDELVALSELIVIGEVAGIEGRWEGSRIFSLITFTNLEVIKGSLPGDSYQVRQLGGSVPPDTQVVVGAPRFQPGQRYVLFIRGNSRNIFPFVGVRQGIYRVVKDSAGNEQVIGLDKAASVSNARLLSGAAVTGVPLADFRRQIKRKLGQP